MASRRAFLGQSLLLLAAAGVGTVPGIAGASIRSGRRPVAISESFTFPEWEAAIAEVARSGRNSADAAFHRATRPAMATLARSVPAVDDALLLVSLASPGVEPFEAKQARQLASLANDRLAEFVGSGRGSMAGLATLSAFDAHAVKEAERALGRSHMVGISLGANRGMRLDNPSLQPVFEFAASSGVPVYLPASYSSLADDLPYRAIGQGGEIMGASAESAAHAFQLIFGGVLDRYPQLRIVLGHMGAGTPYWVAQINEAYPAHVRAGRAGARPAAMDYFGTNLFLSTAGMGPDALRHCSIMFDEGSMLHSVGATAPGLAALGPALRAGTARLTNTAASTLIRQA